MIAPRQLAGAALVAGLALSHGWAYRAGHRASEAAHSAALAQAMEAAAVRQKELIRNVERVAQETYDAQVELERRSADADLALSSLRETLARPADAGAYPVAAPGSDGAATLRQLLDQCAGAYRAVAGDADQLRARVIGLQSYVRGVAQ